MQDSKIFVLLVRRIDFRGTYSVSRDYLYSLWYQRPFGTGDGARSCRGRSRDCYYADRPGRNGLRLSLLKKVSQLCISFASTSKQSHCRVVSVVELFGVLLSRCERPVLHNENEGI